MKLTSCLAFFTFAATVASCSDTPLNRAETTKVDDKAENAFAQYGLEISARNNFAYKEISFDWNKIPSESFSKDTVSKYEVKVIGDKNAKPFNARFNLNGDKQYISIQSNVPAYEDDYARFVVTPPSKIMKP